MALLTSTVALAQGVVRPAGALAVARTAHTATRLGDGRVLVVGGRPVDGSATLASAELFDPRTQRWSPAAPLAAARSHHTATLLRDGRVLVAGGTTTTGEGEQARFTALASAELYEPRSNRWLPAGSLAEPRNGHSATLLTDGTVLVAGGAREPHAILPSTERFDPATGSFSAAPPLSVARTLHAALLLPDASLVVLGGRDATGALPSAERWLPGAPSTHRDTAGASGRERQRAGGRPDLDAGATPGTGGPLRRSGGRSAVDDDRRPDGRDRETAERRAPSPAGRWVAVPPMSEARQRLGAVLLADGRLAVVGGQPGATATNLAETWRVGESAWRPLEQHLSIGLAAHSVTLLPGGDLLVVGGEPPHAVDSARVQRWSRASKRWCLAGELHAGRTGHTATLLADGSVLVTGGTSGGIAEPAAERWFAARGPCEPPTGAPDPW